MTSPYGYPGPLVASNHDPRFLAEAFREGLGLLTSEGYVSLFVRMHPLLSSTTRPESEPSCTTGRRWRFDLTLDEHEWKAGMRKSHRQQIARAAEIGHRAYIDEAWQHFDVFKTAYRLTMKRHRARGHYDFSDAYFDDLRQALGASLKLCVIERGEQVWAAGLFVETNGIVQSHLSGDDGSYRRGGAKKLMYAYVRDWAKERGNRWLHLGGGGTSSGGLLSFKMGFSHELRPFDTLRVILRKDEYERLVAARHPAADPGDASGYFPGYRREG